jgi:hypothetical protein
MLINWELGIRDLYRLRFRNNGALGMQNMGLHLPVSYVRRSRIVRSFGEKMANAGIML